MFITSPCARVIMSIVVTTKYEMSEGAANNVYVVGTAVR